MRGSWKYFDGISSSWSWWSNEGYEPQEPFTLISYLKWTIKLGFQSKPGLGGWRNPSSIANGWQSWPVTIVTLWFKRRTTRERNKVVRAITVAVMQNLLAFGTCRNEDEKKNVSCLVCYVLSKPVLLGKPKTFSYIGASSVSCVQAAVGLFCSTVLLLLHFLSLASSV